MNYWLPDKVYDAIKQFVTVWLPALSVAYVGLAAIWGWPFADQVSKSVAVVYTLLCALMGISGATAKPVVATPDESTDPDATNDLGRHLRGE